jgi:hypothetical protein
MNPSRKGLLISLGLLAGGTLAFLAFLAVTGDGDDGRSLGLLDWIAASVLMGPGFGYLVLSAVAPFWAALDDKLSGCLRGLHDAERNSGCVGEAGATGGCRNGLAVTTTTTEQITEFAMLSAEAPG